MWSACLWRLTSPRSTEPDCARRRGREYEVDPDQKLVLINGGSQGSATLNVLGVGLGERWSRRDDIRVVLKAGRGHVDAVSAALRANGGDRVVRCVDYLERMTTAYAAADLAICRAGAGTVAELATCGLPSILVPYPHSLDDDQAHNAEVLTDAGAALLVADADATAPSRLGSELEELLVSSDRLTAMGGGRDQRFARGCGRGVGRVGARTCRRRLA